MIQRRQFLGTISALAACSATGVSAFAQDLQLERQLDVNWQSRVIQTIPHGKSLRAPVVTGVSVTPDGNMVAIVGDDHYISIYDLKNNRYLKHLAAHTDWVRTAEFSKDGKWLVTAGNDRKFCIWSTSNWDRPVIEKTQPKAIISLTISNDCTRFATVGFEEALRVYGIEDGKFIREYKCECKDNRSVSFSSDDTMIACAGRNGVVHVWDTTSGEIVADFQAHRRRIRALRFTADNRVLTCGEDQIVKITDPKNTSQQITIPRHSAKLFAVQMLDNNLLATAGSDNAIRIWDVTTIKQVGILKGHTGTVSCLHRANDTLVSGSYDTHVRLWDMRNKTAMLAPFQANPSNGWTQKLK